MARSSSLRVAVNSCNSKRHATRERVRATMHVHIGQSERYKKLYNYGGPLGPCSLPNCTLPNSTLHTSKCHIESGKNFKVHTGHRTRHRRHHQLKGRLVRRFCHHLLVLIPIMSSDSATSRDNKETLKACHIS